MTYEDLCAGVMDGSIKCVNAEHFLVLAEKVCGQIEITALDCEAGTITVTNGDESCVIGGGGGGGGGTVSITPLSGCMQTCTSTPQSQSSSQLFAQCLGNFGGGGGDPSCSWGNSNFSARIL